MTAGIDEVGLSKQLAPYVLPQYPLTVRGLKPLTDGNGFVFRVTSVEGRRYVLRLQDPDYLSDDAIQTQFTWLNSILDETDVLVPRPIPLKSGAPFGMLDLPNSAVPWPIEYIQYASER